MATKTVAGIDLGGTHVRAAMVTAEGAIENKVKHSTPEQADDLLDSLVDAVRETAGTEVAAVGVASAGLVDVTGSTVLRSPNLEVVSGMNLREILSERLGCPVRVVNDGSAAALGEGWIGAGRNMSRFLLLTLGTGVGGGVVHNGDLLDVPAEFGHMSIDPEGPLCGCGMRGCLEAFASATAIADRVVQKVTEGRESLIKQCCEGNLYRITAQRVYETALEGDILCRGVLKEAGERLGIGVANLVNIFGPEAVIMSGGLLGAWDFIEPEVEARLRRFAFPELSREVRLLRSDFPDDAGLLGAARIAWQLVTNGEN